MKICQFIVVQWWGEGGGWDRGNLIMGGIRWRADDGHVQAGEFGGGWLWRCAKGEGSKVCKLWCMGGEYLGVSYIKLENSIFKLLRYRLPI